MRKCSHNGSGRRADDICSRWIGRQKGSYKTSEAAQAAGREIKAAYPIVQVSIYDSIDNSHTLVAVTPAS